MAAQTSKFLFKCGKYFMSECREFQWNIFQHEKRNFVSSSDHVIYFFIQNPHKRLINKDVLKMIFWRFPKILQKLPIGHTNVSKHFPKISEDIQVCQGLWGLSNFRCHIGDRVFINFLPLCLPLNKFYNTIILHTVTAYCTLLGIGKNLK